MRLPSYKPSKANSARIEVRSPDSACNPYLTFAVLLAAGLRGIEKGYELPPEAEDDVWSLTDTERRAAGYEDLPVSLGEALTAMESSELVAETLGEHVFELLPAQQVGGVQLLPAERHALRAAPLPPRPLTGRRESARFAHADRVRDIATAGRRQAGD